jgi:hypothetical protein
LSVSGGTFGILIGKLDERTRECSRSGGNCNVKFAFPMKLDRGSPIQGFGPREGEMVSVESALVQESDLSLGSS